MLLVLFLVVGAGAVVWFVGRGRSPTLPALLSPETTSGPGTPLPDGFAVPDGSVLLGPVLLQEQQGNWLAVLAATGDPLPVWRDYARQLADRFPDEGIVPEQAPGCSVDSNGRFGCELTVESPDGSTGGAAFAGATLVNPPDDVTGRYLVVLRHERHPVALDADGPRPERPAWTGGTSPQPQPPRRPPRVGVALAPSSVAYSGDEARYVLLDGSEMLAQWGTGGVTGGFDVLLRVTPESQAETVGEAYAEQAAQREGDIEIRRFQVGDTAYIRYSPPGGAGGYQGTIWVVDQPGDLDYIFYSLGND